MTSERFNATGQSGKYPTWIFCKRQLLFGLAPAAFLLAACASAPAPDAVSLAQARPAAPAAPPHIRPAALTLPVSTTASAQAAAAAATPAVAVTPSSASPSGSS